MPTNIEVSAIKRQIDDYLTDILLPFWIERSPDPEYGGFLTHFDSSGQATGVTEKSFLSQIRILFTMASAHRAGYGNGRCGKLAQNAANFILDHYWDDEHDGWMWVADRAGRIANDAKVGYGQCFGIYAFSEYYLATGDERGKEAALRSFDAVCRHMADQQYGGFIELFERDWTPLRGPTSGGDRKSLDVHMHMMEAFTTLFEMTGRVTHRRHLEETISLIQRRMIDQTTGLGIAQFNYDFSPIPAINFDMTWGRDADPDAGQNAKPLDQTSPGHNVELAWLLLHAADVMGIEHGRFAETVRSTCDHCVEFGIDHEYGGVFADVPMTRPTTQTEKQFWQQGEVLIGMLDAYRMFGDAKYWNAFVNVLEFTFDKFIAMDAGGEWYERVDRQGNVLDGDLAHSWKINYHSVRSMIQSSRRLSKLV